MPRVDDLYLTDPIGLRDGSATSFYIMNLKGMVAFPSFHAALAALFTYAHRGWPGFAPVAALNAVMLVAVPSEGGHYLVDVVAGLAIAGWSILAIRAARARQRAVIWARPA